MTRTPPPDLTLLYRRPSARLPQELDHDPTLTSTRNSISAIFHFDKEKDYPIRLVQDTTCLPFIKHDQKQEYRFGFEIVTDGDVTFTYKTPRPFSLPDKDTGELKMVGSIRRGRAHHRHGRAYHVNIFTQYATLEKYEGKWKLLVFVDDKLARAVDFEVVAPQETP